MSTIDRYIYRDLRAEEATLASKDRNEDIIAVRDFSHQLRQAEVAILGHGIELFLEVESDDGNAATVLDRHRRLWVSVRHNS